MIITITAEIISWERRVIFAMLNMAPIPAKVSIKKNSNLSAAKNDASNTIFKWVNKAVRVSKKALIIIGAIAKGMISIWKFSDTDTRKEMNTKSRVTSTIKVTCVFWANIFFLKKARNKKIMLIHKNAAMN